MKKIVILVIVGAALASLIWMAVTNREDSFVDENIYTLGDPLDITLDTINSWRDNIAPETEEAMSLTEFLMKDVFTRALATSLLSLAEDTSREPLRDVILCQSEVPPRIVGRLIVQTETEAQVMVMARGTENRSPFQTIVTLLGNGEGAWVISRLECAQGEVAPEVEFTFDYEGYLLKSVPPPYQAGEWHVVFAQDGQMGYVAPLTFTNDSVCISSNGDESVCNPAIIQEPAPALVQGDMTEVGVNVKRITFN